MDQKIRFTEIYNKNLFNGTESRSGTGSNLDETIVIRKELPKLFKEFNIKTVLDAPCGDWNWMRKIDLSMIEQYIGADIVDEIININNKNYAKENISFKNINIIANTLPKVDLILCRDFLVHLTYEDIFIVVENFKKSGSKYLLTTSFPSFKYPNQNLVEIDIWRALNLEKNPFSFCDPLKIINEHDFGEPYYMKTLMMWDIKEIKIGKH